MHVELAGQGRMFCIASRLLPRCVPRPNSCIRPIPRFGALSYPLQNFLYWVLAGRNSVYAVLLQLAGWTALI